MKKVLAWMLVWAMTLPMVFTVPVFATEDVTVYSIYDAFTEAYATGDEEGTFNDGDHIWTIGYFDPQNQTVTPYTHFGRSSTSTTVDSKTWGTRWRSGYEDAAVDYATTSVLYGSMGVSASRTSCGFTPGMESDAHYYPTAVFKAPEAGLYVFDGAFYRGGTATRQDGHLLRVMKRTVAGALTNVWPQGNDAWAKAQYGLDTTIPWTAVELAKDDQLLLMVDRNGNQHADEYSIRFFDIEQVSGIPTYEKSLYTVSYSADAENIIDLSLPHLDGTVVYESSDEDLLAPMTDGTFEILGASNHGGVYSSPFSTPVTVTATHTDLNGNETVRQTTVHTLAYTVADQTETDFVLDSFADISVDGNGVWEVLHEHTTALTETYTNYLKTPLAIRNNGSSEYYQYITAAGSTYRPYNSEIFAANNQNVVLAFTVPYEGYWSIPSSDIVCTSGGKSDAHPNWDGVYAAIRTEDQVLWPASTAYNNYQYVEAKTTVSTTAIQNLLLEAGDKIYFVLNPGANSYGDASSWKPAMKFVAPIPEEVEPLPVYSIWDAFTYEYAEGDEDGTYNDGEHLWTIGAYNGTQNTLTPYTCFGLSAVGKDISSNASWGMSWKDGYIGTVVNVSESAQPYYGTIGVSKTHSATGFTAGFVTPEHHSPAAVFKAPRTGLYLFNGSMRRLSTATNQDGHLVKVAKKAKDGTVTGIWPEAGLTAADGTTGWKKANYGTDTIIPLTSVALTEGDQLMLIIDRNGNQYSDEYCINDFKVECVDTIAGYQSDFTLLTHYGDEAFADRNVADFSVLTNPYAQGTVTYTSSNESVLKPHADQSGKFDIVGASHTGGTFAQNALPTPVTITATFTPTIGTETTVKTTTAHVMSYTASPTDTTFTLDGASDLAMDGKGYWRALYEKRTDLNATGTTYQPMFVKFYEPDTTWQYPCYFTEAGSRYRFNNASLVPIMSENIVLSFTIPYSGYWDLPATDVVCSTTVKEGWDGVKVAIRTDEKVLWPDDGDFDDFYYVAPQTTVSSPAKTLYLEMGTHLYFVVSAGDSQHGDGMSWKPTVSYNTTLNEAPEEGAEPIGDYEKAEYYLHYYTKADAASQNIVDLSLPITPGIPGSIRYTSSDETVLKPVDETSGKFKVLTYTYSGGATKNFPEPLTVCATFTELDGTETVKTTAVQVMPYDVGENDIAYELSGIRNIKVENEGVWQIYYENTVDLTATGTTYQQVPSSLYTTPDGYRYFRFYDASDIQYRPDNIYMRPSATENLVLAFVAPKDGRYIIPSATITPYNMNATDDIAYAIRTESKTLIPKNGAYNDFITVTGNTAFETQATEISLKKGEKVYFVLNAGAVSARNNVYYKPKVTVNPSAYEPNPYALTAYENVAPINVLSDYGTEHLDSLQASVMQVEATVTVTGNSSGTAAGIADAASDRDPVTATVFSSDGTVTATFDTARKLEDMTMFLSAKKGVGSTYCIELYYSENGTDFHHFYTATNTEVLGKNFDQAYPLIRLSDFGDKLPAVKAVRAKIILDGFFDNTVTVSEWDINTQTDSEAVLASRAAAAKILRLPSIFASGMILQRDKDIKISGFGGTEAVTVTLKDASGKTVSTATVPVTDSAWSAVLPPQKGGHDKFSITVTDTTDAQNTLTIDNILFGDLWLMGGQSNMSFGMQMIDTYTEDKNAANFDEIRCFMQTEIGSMQLQTNPLGGKWSPAIGSNIAGWSAVGYHYAKTLYEGLDKEIPIGILKTSIGATGAESWLSEEALTQDDLFAGLNDFRDHIRDSKIDYYERRAVAGFNAMTHPLTQLNVKGAIWYQGEGNTGDFSAAIYETLLRRVIACWREEFNDARMPFHVVQLSALETTGGWMEIREAQLQVALTDPNVALAVSIDVGNKIDIHPTNKRPVGQRLGAAALYETYGKNIPHSGPIFESATKTENGLILTFTETDGGLVAKDSTTLNGFELSADGLTYTAATAKIVGDTVVVTGVADATYVRYGWDHWFEPALNFYNGAGFPASPFRAKAETATYTQPTVTREQGKIVVSGSVANYGSALMQPAIIVLETETDGSQTLREVLNPAAALYETNEYQLTLTDNGKPLRILFWESLNNLKPLCAPIIQ